MLVVGFARRLPLLERASVRSSPGSRCCLLIGYAFSWVFALHRADRVVARGGERVRVHDPLPADVRLVGVRPRRLDAELAPADRGAQPVHVHGQRRPRAVPRDSGAALHSSYCWRRYGAFVLSVAVLIVVGTAAKVGWDHGASGGGGGRSPALRRGPARAGCRPAERRQPNNSRRWRRRAAPDFAALARLKEAEAKLGQKDEAGALTALDQLATTTGDDPILRDLATLTLPSSVASTGRPGRAEKDPRAARSARFALAASGARASRADAIRAGNLGQGPQPAERSQPGGRRSPVAAAPGGGTAAGDRRGRAAGRLMSAVNAPTVLLAGAGGPAGGLRRRHLARRELRAAAARRAQVGSPDRGRAAADPGSPNSTSPCRRRCATQPGRSSGGAPTHAMSIWRPRARSPSPGVLDGSVPVAAAARDARGTVVAAAAACSPSTPDRHGQRRRRGRRPRAMAVTTAEEAEYVDRLSGGDARGLCRRPPLRRRRQRHGLRAGRRPPGRRSGAAPIRRRSAGARP